MNAEERFKLRKEKPAFLEDLRPKWILPYLVDHNILTTQEREYILAEESRRNQVEKLFDILPKKSSKAFQYFIDALNEKDKYGCQNYPFLAQKLSEPINADLKVHVSNILVNGGVPFSINFLHIRPNKLDEVFKCLRAASDKERYWVVLHGMTGTGKSVLAAECLRSNDLIENYYPGGVFWIPIGKINDENAMWLKIKLLLHLLGINKEMYANKELYDLRVMLRKEIIKRKQKILLVLDDVWDKTVIQRFDIGCPVLVTTKMKDVFPNDSLYCFIGCKNDWNIEESKELLSKYVNCHHSDLPDCVDDICRRCKGKSKIQV